MIYEYAVDPSFFINIDKVEFILASFGKGTGRLISEIKKDFWRNLVRETVDQSHNRSVDKHKLKEALIILSKKQKAIYCRQQQVEASSWLEVTRQTHKDWPYRGILVEQYDGNDDHYLVKNIHIHEKRLWQSDESITVKRDAVSMVDALKPLLEISREIILVDRHFRLENYRGKPVDRFKNVLVSLLDLLSHKKYGPPVKKLTLHIGQAGQFGGLQTINESVIRNIKGLCVKYLKDYIPSDFILEIAVWPWGELHDRLLITENGCVDLGQGSDEASIGTVTFKRLSSTDHVSNWKKFKQKKPDIILS